MAERGQRPRLLRGEKLGGGSAFGPGRREIQPAQRAPFAKAQKAVADLQRRQALLFVVLILIVIQGREALLVQDHA